MWYYFTTYMERSLLVYLLFFIESSCKQDGNYFGTHKFRRVGLGTQANNVILNVARSRFLADRPCAGGTFFDSLGF